MWISNKHEKLYVNVFNYKKSIIAITIHSKIIDIQNIKKET